MYRSWPLTAALAVAAVFVLTVGCNVAADKADITGKYKCEGINDAGKVYKGTVEVTKQGDAYFVTWATGVNDNYEGIGILEGDVLGVSYYGAISGIAVYKVEKGGKLSGKWTLPNGKGKVYTETWTK